MVAMDLVPVDRVPPLGSTTGSRAVGAEPGDVRRERLVLVAGDESGRGDPGQVQGAA
jgi:hypothetical protein